MTHDAVTTQAVADASGHRLGIAEIRQFAARRAWNHDAAGSRPPAFDLRGWLRGPIADQGLVPLCTATATTTLAQYWAKREAGIDFLPSVLFNYRLSRRLACLPNRYGSTLKDSFAAWRTFGMVRDDQWAYRDDRVDVDPPAELLTAAAQTRNVVYARLDGAHLIPLSYLDQVRTCLSWGLPLTVEFPLGRSLVSSFASGVVAMPPAGELRIGSHVVVVIGYDDDFPTGEATGSGATGALRFRNNWGVGWGEAGYGWLPYEFLLRSVARQTWLVLESPWSTNRIASSET